MANWYSETSTIERRTFWACFGGWALDALDIQLFSLVIPTLLGLWHISSSSSRAPSSASDSAASGPPASP